MELYATYVPGRHGGIIKISKRTDELGNVPVTLDDAKAAWNAGRVTDCNLTFQRLAENEFDTAATIQFYKDNP